jgi:hypothetical protein
MPLDVSSLPNTPPGPLVAAQLGDAEGRFLAPLEQAGHIYLAVEFDYWHNKFGISVDA